MNDSYFSNSQGWALSLRELMGYPLHTPACHSIAWITSGLRQPHELEQITTLAIDMGRDLIHLAFNDDTAEPMAVSMAIRQTASVDWFAGVRLYAAAEYAPVELLAHNRRWSVGPRHMLASAKLPPVNRRAQGEAIAMRRWRNAAAAMKQIAVTGSMWVAPGDRLESAIPYELDIAA